MIEAETTWALVVGIDAYDHVAPLDGSVADAAAVVGWLRQLGVADERILLHALPSERSRPIADGLNLPYGECTENAIWKSIFALRQQTGSRLFVFLMGHGFYEPRGFRIFLTQEAQEGDMANFGLDWLCRYLRGLRFGRQFVIMDGCLNLPYSASLRSSIAPGVHNGVEVPPEVSAVAQWLAFGADREQRALEIDGRGLFTRTLLATIDLDTPNPVCAVIDDATGNYQLDLVRAIQGQVSQQVQQTAISRGFKQIPGIHTLSGTLDRAVVATVAPAGSAPLSTVITPQEGAEDVAAVVLQPQGLLWNRRVPSPPSTRVEVPFTTFLPAQLRVRAWCEMKADTTWDEPALQTFTVGDRPELKFELTQRQPVVVVTTASDTSPALPQMSLEGWSAVSDALESAGAGSVTMLRDDDDGLILRAPAGDDALLDFAREAVVAAVDENTPPHVHASVQPYSDVVPSSNNPTTTVAVELSREEAFRLAGLAADTENVTIAGLKFSLLDLVSAGPIDTGTPGPALIQANLPSGRWTTVAEPDADDPRASVPVKFPATIGQAPVRNRLLSPRLDISGPLDEEFPYPAVIAFARDQGALDSYSVPYAFIKDGRIPGRDEMDWIRAFERSDWEPEPWDAAFIATRVGEYARIDLPGDDVSVVFPLIELISGVEIEPAVRVEPLSFERDPAWEAVVCLGRLESVERADIPRLARSEAPLLRLAAAYCCYANRFDDLLVTTVADLFDDQIFFGDTLILLHAAAMAGGELAGHSPEVGMLSWLAASPLLPVFRWGISIGRLVAEHYGSAALEAKLGWIEPRLVPESVTTAWFASQGFMTASASAPALSDELSLTTTTGRL